MYGFAMCYRFTKDPAYLKQSEGIADFFLNLPEIDRSTLERIDIRTSQLISPLFEYSGACSGCGETPYIKLLTQLYGDRMLMLTPPAARRFTGGNLPSTPYTTDANGRGRRGQTRCSKTTPNLASASA